MKAHPLPITLFIACLTVSALAEDNNSANTTTTEATRALLREDAKIKAAQAAVPATPIPTTTAPAKSDKPDASVAATPSSTPPPSPPAVPLPKAEAKTAKPAEPATMLPAVEVNRSKINEINREIHEEDLAIAREKKNTKSTELDKALNDPKISIPILGGQSTQYRETVASERVSLMQDEKDILEEMKLAKTKEEKAELQKELDEIKAMRRDLEKNLR